MFIPPPAPVLLHRQRWLDLHSLPLRIVSGRLDLQPCERCGYSVAVAAATALRAEEAFTAGLRPQPALLRPQQQCCSPRKRSLRACSHRQRCERCRSCCCARCGRSERTTAQHSPHSEQAAQHRCESNCWRDCPLSVFYGLQDVVGSFGTIQINLLGMLACLQAV